MGGAIPRERRRARHRRPWLSAASRQTIAVRRWEERRWWRDRGAHLHRVFGRAPSACRRRRACRSQAGRMGAEPDPSAPEVSAWQAATRAFRPADPTTSAKTRRSGAGDPMRSASNRLSREEAPSRLGVDPTPGAADRKRALNRGTSSEDRKTTSAGPTWSSVARRSGRVDRKARIATSSMDPSREGASPVPPATPGRCPPRVDETTRSAAPRWTSAVDRRRGAEAARECAAALRRAGARETAHGRWAALRVDRKRTPVRKRIRRREARPRDAGNEGLPTPRTSTG